MKTKQKLYHKSDYINGKFIDRKELMHDFDYINDSGDLVTSNQEIREYFRYNKTAYFLGGFPCSYIILSESDCDSLEILQEYHGELYKYEDSDYWYEDEKDPENSYNTFLDQFCICEPITLKKLITKLRELN